MRYLLAWAPSQARGVTPSCSRHGCATTAPRACLPRTTQDAKGAIAVGLKFSNAGQWEQAQQFFERALELPGTGLKRWRDKPPALSTGELTAALCERC